MKQISATAYFASTHVDTSEGPHRHGHSFRATATEMGSEEHIKYDLFPDLSEVVNELHLHSLDDMLLGGSQSLDGIAAWIMERLLTRHPRVVRVDLSTMDGPEVVVTVTRELR